FLLPVLVSAAVVVACGAVFLGATPDAETFDLSTGAKRTLTEAEFGEADASSLRTSAPLDPSAPRRSFGRGQATDSAALTPEDEDADWELELADSEEVEPNAEMIEEERQKIREGRPS